MKKWKVQPKKSADLITQLLINRGISSKEEIEEFFNPKLTYFEKELNIPNIKVAQKRIEKAIEKEELIIVYGDYDVDGLCASAILYKALTSLGAKVLPYIPHRDKEGYGLSITGLEHCRDSGASVVITVDNGIVAIKQAEFAKELGLDLIITDHHLPLEKKPEAFTIVHSTKMCGASVAWCLIRQMVDKRFAKELLQFACIATIADMIPLTGLGRAFVTESIKTIDNLGLKYLASECGISLEEIGSYEIGHIIAPRLNAIGRLEHAIDGLRLLCTKDPIKAKKLAQLLCVTNLRRQKLTEDAIVEARFQVDTSKKIHILDSKDWPAGIIGLIASRVAEEYSRPAIAISVRETHAKGSARSSNGLNIVEVIRQCSDLLIDVGGHSGAAGFSLTNENIEKFRDKMESILKDLPENAEPVLEIEAEVSVKDLTKKLAKEIEKLEPFGFGNPKPLLCIKGVNISDVRTLSEGKHLKFKVVGTEQSRSTDGIDAIAFGMGGMSENFKDNQLADVAFYLEINKFRGNETLQLMVKDIIIQ